MQVFSGADAFLGSHMTQETIFSFCACHNKSRMVTRDIIASVIQRRCSSIYKLWAWETLFQIPVPPTSFSSVCLSCQMGLRQPFLTGCDAGAQIHCRQQCWLAFWVWTWADSLGKGVSCPTVLLSPHASDHREENQERG